MIKSILAASTATLLLLVSGCGTYENVRDTVVDKGREFATTKVNEAEWVLCKAAPVGTIADKYWQNPNKRFAWATFCSVDDVELPNI